jgi:cytochrome c
MERNEMKSLILVSVVLASTIGMAQAQDLDAGERSFRKCAPCHAVGEDARNKVGPELNGLDGRKSGTADGYHYSDANKNANITWGEETFKEYIKAPTAKVPGTKMAFAGIKNEKEISNLWAYLKQFKADGTTK